MIIKLLAKKTVLIFAALFISLVPVLSFAGSWNGWIYQNPYPTKNTLLAVKFITPKKGWMAGQYGTILHTEDGGETWEAQESGTEQDLKSVSFVNEKQGWVVGNGGIIAHTDDGGKTWKKQGDAAVDLHKVFFINDKDGWAGGNSGILLHTQDGGKNWTRIPVGTGLSIAGIFFRNPNIGWVLSGGTVYRTLDGGKNWEASAKFPVNLQRVSRVGGGIILSGRSDELPADWWLGDLFFIDDKKGWAVTGHWYIFHTEDGGATWQAQYSEYMTYNFGNIFFADPHKGCATGTSILCTEDGGKTWKERLGIQPGDRARVEGFLVSLGGLNFIGPSAGWAVGEVGQIWKTEDSGKNWKIWTRGKFEKQPYFIDERTGYLFGFGDSEIFRTDDGGDTWKIQNIGIEMSDIFFLDDKKGWAVGWERKGKDRDGRDKFYGVIVHSEDGGKKWKTQLEEPIGKRTGLSSDGLLGIFFLNPDSGWAAGSNGIILHTEAGGKHWEHQQSRTKLHVKSVQFIDAKRGIVIADNRWAVGEDDEADKKAEGVILYTDDGGKHWRTVWKSLPVLLTSLSFNDKKTAWVTGDIPGGALLINSKDGGKTWSEKRIDGISLDSACFVDKDRGVLFIDQEQMLVTTDSGKSWKKQKKPLHKLPWKCSEIFDKTQTVK